MLFSSLPFLFGFLPLFLIAYYVAKKRSVRNIILLVFSLFFYAWGEPIYVFLMLFGISAEYFYGYFVAKYIALGKRKIAKRILIVSIVQNLSILAFFKYIDFFISNLKLIPAFSGLEPLGIVLPLGISFYTFHTISYTVDIYRGDAVVQKSITTFGAYVTEFPQLVAGPIIRYHTIADQLMNRKESFEDFAIGLRRFSAGMAKKVLISNNVASLADGILALKGSEYGAIGAWLAMIAYTIQIYFDFSGYSDMAIGLGRMMGFHYLENFDYPYISKSVTEFWRRWHISLSTFFRDYVYIPLGGSRVKKSRWVLNILIVWFLTGLWHGANWTFVLWGLYFGVLLLIEKTFLQKNILKVPGLRNIYTIAAFMFGWVIFRSGSIGQIGDIVSSMFGKNGTGSFVSLVENEIVQIPYLVAIVFGIILSMPVSRYVKKFLSDSPVGLVVIDVASILALVYCVFSLVVGSYNPFIYFIF